MKGASPLVAVILVLLITVSLTGLGVLFISTATESAKTLVAEQQAQESGGSPRIDHVTNYSVYVYSAGRTELKNPVFYVNGQKIDAKGPVTLTPGLIGIYELDQQQLGELPEISEIKVAAGNSIDILVTKIRDVFPTVIKMGANLAMGSVVTAQANAILFQSSYGKGLAIITDSGSVGIGNTNPSKMLDVSGGIKGSEICIGGVCRSSWPNLSYQVVTTNCTNNLCIATCPAGESALSGGCASSGYSFAFGAKTLACKDGQLGGECTDSWLCSAINSGKASIRTTVICTNTQSKV